MKTPAKLIYAVASGRPLFLFLFLALPTVSFADPQAITLPASNITPTGATLNASVNPGGVATIVSFQYGTTTNYGTSTTATPLGAGLAPIAFPQAVTGLVPGTTYHYRVIGNSTLGQVNGADVTFTASQFTPVSIALPGVGHGSVAWGDFDSDGLLDILLTGQNTNSAGVSQIWRNIGTNVFTNLNVTLTGVSNSSVVWGDLDNTGKLDFVLAGLADTIPVTQVWRNLGNGAFTNLNVPLPGVDAGSIALADYDNEGRLDILLTGSASSGAVSQIWHNLGNGTFVNINAPLPAVMNSSVAWADYDNDGNPDFVIAGSTSGSVSGALCQVWHNSGNGTFANINAGLPGVFQGAVAWGDFDNDGKPDLLITGDSATGPIAQVWRNLGNGTFANINAGLPGVSQSAVAVGDFDNDGKLDILLTGLDVNSNAIAQVWRNLGNGVFTNFNAGLPGVSLGSAAWVDLNNDGRLDILLSGFDATNNPVLSLYTNSTPLANTNTLRLTNLTRLTSGFPRFQFKAATGFSYLVQASTNLANWSTLGPPAQATPGLQQFSDGNATNFPHRFYRVSRP